MNGLLAQPATCIDQLAEDGSCQMEDERLLEVVYYAGRAAGRWQRTGKFVYDR